MILHNALLIDQPGPVDVTIGGSRILHVGEAAGGSLRRRSETVIDLEGALLFPGLINSHDHLDFNLFPRLGTEIYKNYTEWGSHLHQTYRPEINAVMRVPLLIREQWGILKNLLAGVTTVVNHGLPLKTKDPVVGVHERYHCLHSVAFEKNWRRKLNNPFRMKYPYVIHVGEGTDRAAHKEIDRLLRWNWLHKSLVGVHAVAMNSRQARAFDAIVWCPGSNFFMLNQTAAIDRLKETATILFGTDSTLTASWNIWDHIRLGRKTGLLADEELYRSLNENAARTWKTGCSRIAAGEPASLAVARIPQETNRMDAFFGINPDSMRLVLQEGCVRLFDESLAEMPGCNHSAGFSRIIIGRETKYVKADLAALTGETNTWLPETGFPFTLD